MLNVWLWLFFAVLHACSVSASRRDFASSNQPPLRFLGVFAMQRSSTTDMLGRLAISHPCFLPAHEWLRPKHGYQLPNVRYTQGQDVLEYADQVYDRVMERYCPEECNKHCIIMAKFFNRHVQHHDLYTRMLLSPSMLPVVIRRHNDTAHACSTFRSWNLHDYHSRPNASAAADRSCPNISKANLQKFLDTKNEWYAFLEETLRPRMSITLSFEANVAPETFEVTKAMLLRMADFGFEPSDEWKAAAEKRYMTRLEKKQLKRDT